MRTSRNGTVGSGPAPQIASVGYAFADLELGGIAAPSQLVVGDRIILQAAGEIAIFRRTDGENVVDGYDVAELVWNLDTSELPENYSLINHTGVHVAGSSGNQEFRLYYAAQAIFGNEGGSVIVSRDLDGNFKWEREFPNSDAMELFVADKVYVTRGDNILSGDSKYYLGAYDLESGMEIWVQEVPPEAVGNSQILIFGDRMFRHEDGEIVAHSNEIPALGEDWRFTLPDEPHLSKLPKVDMMAYINTVYVANGPHIYALDMETGSLKWDTKLPLREGCLDDSIAYVSAGLSDIYVSAVCAQEIYALDIQTGAESWHKELGLHSLPNLATSNQFLYAIGTVNFVPALYILDPANGNELQVIENPMDVDFLPVNDIAITDGRVYLMTPHNSGLYSIYYEREPADIQIQMTEEPEFCALVSNQVVTHKATVRNNGPGNVKNARLYVRGGDAEITVTSSHETCTETGGFYCDLGELAASESIEVTFDAVVPEMGTYSLVADLSSDLVDSDSSNNRIVSDLYDIIEAPSDNIDIELTGIEVTQGVQNLANEVELVRGKSTLVRLYYTSNADLPAVHARLEVLDGESNHLRGSPVIQDSVECPAIMAGSSSRDDLSSTINIIVPSTKADEITFNAELFPSEGYPEDVDPGNNSISVTLPLYDVNPICLMTYSLRTDDAAGNDLYENELIPRDIIERAEKLLPINNIYHYPQGHTIEEFEFVWGPWEVNDTDDDATAILNSLWWHANTSRDPWQCRETNGRTIYTGMLHPDTKERNINGVARLNKDVMVFSPIMDGTETFNVPTGGRTLAHELGHNFGRKHVDCGGPKNPDGNYPYNRCQMSPNTSSAFYGVDLFDQEDIRLITPTSAADFMSYAASRWASDYTWSAMMGQLHCQRYELCVWPPDAISGRGIDELPKPRRTLSDGDILMMSGIVTTESVMIDYAARMPSSTIPSEKLEKLEEERAEAMNSGSPFSVVLFDDSSMVLHSEPILVEELTEGGGGSVFAFAVPYDPATARIEIQQNSVTVASRNVSANAPTVSILTPSSSTMVSDTLGVTWESMDADGDDLTHLIQYSSDSGDSWKTLAANIPDSSFMMPADYLEGADGTAMIRVIVSDGILSGSDTSDLFSVEPKDPITRISRPRDEGQYPAGQTVFFEGSSYDPEDGYLLGESLSWSVDGIGEIATGDTAFYKFTNPGLYMITLSGVDSDGQENIDMITIRIGTDPLSDILDRLLLNENAGEDQNQDSLIDASDIIELQNSP